MTFSKVCGFGFRKTEHSQTAWRGHTAKYFYLQQPPHTPHQASRVFDGAANCIFLSCHPGFTHSQIQLPVDQILVISFFFPLHCDFSYWEQLKAKSRKAFEQLKGTSFCFQKLGLGKKVTLRNFPESKLHFPQEHYNYNAASSCPSSSVSPNLEGHLTAAAHRS